MPGDVDSRKNPTTMSRLVLLTLFMYYETAGDHLARNWSYTSSIPIQIVLLLPIVMGLEWTVLV